MDLQQTLHKLILDAYGIVLALLLRRVDDRHAAEDLAQEAFLSVLHPGFDPTRPDAIGFVKKKALWLAESRRRRLARIPRLLPLELAALGADSSGQAPEQEYRDRAHRLISEAVDTLPTRQRDFVVAFFVRGVSVLELARSSGLAPQTVRCTLSRAKKAILVWLGLARITNGQMRVLLSIAAETTSPTPETSAAPVPALATSEGASMATVPNDHDPHDKATPALPGFPKPDKAERDTLLCRRRALRSAIKHLLRCGRTTTRHDQIMCALNNRSAGRISEVECDRLWVAFATEFGLEV
jgi:RNA polymerase sigma-70 factor (ECF subfamily)